MAENGTIKERADREKGGKLSHGGQKRRTWETGSKREGSELEETPAGVVVLVWTKLSGRGNGSGARVGSQRHGWCVFSAAQHAEGQGGTEIWPVHTTHARMLVCRVQTEQRGCITLKRSNSYK